MRCPRLSAAAALITLCAGCSSSTVIQSEPPGATLYMNGEKVGATPYSHRDTKIMGSATVLTLRKPGYREFTTILSRDEELNVPAIIGGVFLVVPFLWSTDYKPRHLYELEPVRPEDGCLPQ